MKKIKIYILTYKRTTMLHRMLRTLFNSDFKDVPNTEVNIINNHSNFNLQSEYKSRVNVIHNMCRPDWSGANQGENWNQALILGFKSLRNPDAEIVITLQNDCILHPQWCSHLLKMHQKYTFICGEYGDNIVSYRVEAVKKIGLWDENFCGGGIRDADYLLRALYFNKKKSLINDTMHRRIWNPHNDYLTLDIAEGLNIDENLKKRPDDTEHEIISVGIRGGVMNEYNNNYFFHKWSHTHRLPVTKQTWVKNWPTELKNNPPKIKKNIVLMRYPYFEKDIEDLPLKGYWIPSNFNQQKWDEWETKTKESNSDTY